MKTFRIKKDNISFSMRYTLISEEGLFSVIGYICDVVNGESSLKRDTCSLTITVSKENTNYEDLSEALKYIEAYIVKENETIVQFNTLANIEFEKLNKILLSNEYEIYSVSSDKGRTFNLYKKYIKH